jgi:hypothetical protein
VWCLATFLFAAIEAYGQVTALSGKVLDSTGAVVPGATVTLTSITGAVRTQLTNDVGVYQFLQLPPGTYQVKAELQGFKTAVKDKVDLMVDTPVAMDFSLEVGNISETVTVEAGATRINTADATLGNTFEAKRIVELPLMDRNVAGLLSLQPAVTQDGYVTGSRSDQSNLTLDGIDVNEQQEGTAFETVLRVNPDSVQEFRVTTTTPTAAQGRSSGGQVSLITRTGTNNWHGSVYEYHRNDATSANDFFNNRTFVVDAQGNRHGTVPNPKLIRNLFGASLGGPVKKDRVFFFYNYEGRRDAKELPVVRDVPTASLGRGEVKYENTAGGITTLTQADINRIYPAVGANPAAIAVLADAARKYPANDNGVGDGLNYAGFRFNAPLPVSYNAHTATLSFNLDEQSRHILTLRGNYQHDNEDDFRQFPDTQSPHIWGHPIGLGAVYTWTVNPKMVNTLRAGLTRQAFTQSGDADENSISFRFVFSPKRFVYDLSRTTPVWNFVDDLAWNKGNHTLQFGTNIRLIRNQRTSRANSYDNAIANPSFYASSGAVLTNPIPDIAGNRAGVQAGLTAVIGRFSQYAANWNFDLNGQLMPLGTGVERTFATEEYEFYVQDQWRLRSNLTATFGLRYGLNTPVYETTGFQVAPTTSLSDFFAMRKESAAKGTPYNALISVAPAGPHYDKPGFYDLDKNNFAPRAAIAWSPNFENEFLKKLFGTGQKSVFRAGFAMTHDRVGSRLAVSYDLNNTLGFSSNQTIAANTYNVSTRPAPLFTAFGQSVRTLPKITIPTSMPLTTPADEDQRIETSLDDGIITPTNYSWNFSFARELPRGITVEASYIGRAARNLLATRDITQLNNLTDPKSGMDWYGAMKRIAELREKNTPITSVQKIAYFENIFPLLPQWFEDESLTATQAAYAVMARESVGGWNLGDYTYAQLMWDDGLGYGDNLFFHPQYAALSAWSTVGYSDYHAGTLSVRQHLSRLNWDFNYTFGKSTDIGSGLQNGLFYGGGFILNSLRPQDMHAVSDFDVRHMINSNAVWDLPVGRGRTYLASASPVLDAILGGWRLSGVWRWNSGLPDTAPFDAQVWATNWNAQSNGVRIRSIESSPTKSGDNPNMFSNPVAAYQSFRNAYAGETGDRNIFRRQSYISIDFGLYKSFAIPGHDEQRITFRWEVFNMTNTQRLAGPNYTRSGMGLDLDPYASTPGPDFGNIIAIQGSPRVMQFALRYEF